MRGDPGVLGGEAGRSCARSPGTELLLEVLPYEAKSQLRFWLRQGRVEWSISTTHHLLEISSTGKADSRNVESCSSAFAAGFASLAVKSQGLAGPGQASSVVCRDCKGRFSFLDWLLGSIRVAPDSDPLSARLAALGASEIVLKPERFLIPRAVWQGRYSSHSQSLTLRSRACAEHDVRAERCKPGSKVAWKRRQMVSHTGSGRQRSSSLTVHRYPSGRL